MSRIGSVGDFFRRDGNSTTAPTSAAASDDGPFARWRSLIRKRQRGGDDGSTNSNRPVVVGTEAAAVAALARNAKTFRYPPGGFVERIEYSLIYSMLCEPKIYPERVVLDHVNSEDMSVYLYANPSHPRRDRRERDDDDDDDDEENVSYAQLGALLALSAEKFPPNDSSSKNNDNDGDDVPTRTCAVVLRTVVRYAESRGLDREAEIRELLGPVERHAANRSKSAAMRNIMPFYLGYVASMMTANPLPMLVGASITCSTGQEEQKEEDNHASIQRVAQRKADVETAGLLDEAEDDL